MDFAFDSNDQVYRQGFQQVAASLGVSPNLLGARLFVVPERERETNKDMPDYVYFRGYNLKKGEFGFALSDEPDTRLVESFGGTTFTCVAWRWIQRVLQYPENRHLLEEAAIVPGLSDKALALKLREGATDVSVSPALREILVAAANRIERSQRT